MVLLSLATAGRAYDQNRGLDSNGDGSVTKAEASAKVLRHRHPNPWSRPNNMRPGTTMSDELNIDTTIYDEEYEQEDSWTPHYRRQKLTAKRRKQNRKLLLR